MSIKIDYVCDQCGNELDGYVAHNVLVIYPCERCMNESYDKGYDKGHDEALSINKDNNALTESHRP